MLDWKEEVKNKSSYKLKVLISNVNELIDGAEKVPEIKTSNIEFMQPSCDLKGRFSCSFSDLASSP